MLSEARKAYINEYNRKNRDKIRSHRRTYYLKNKELLKQKAKVYREKTKEEHGSPDRREYQRQYRIKNRVRIAAKRKQYYEQNKEHIRETARKWRRENREKSNERTQSWRRRNRHKMRVYNQNRSSRTTSGKLSENIIEKLLKLQKGKCACCSKSLGNNYHLDHIIPLARGGLNVDANTQLLRSTCNSQKSTMDPIDYMRKRHGKLL